jgi:DNA-binding response OmpR family regulator
VPASAVSLRKDVAVLMLTARDTEADKRRDFDAGADTTASLLELLARLQALVRRHPDPRGCSRWLT